MSELWIETADERVRRLGEGAAPYLLADATEPDPRPDDSGPDLRPAWLARLTEAFPPGGPGEPVEDWAAVSRRIGDAVPGRHRVETARTKLHALARLAGGVPDGWAPVMVVDLRSGAGWRAVLTCHADRYLRW